MPDQPSWVKVPYTFGGFMEATNKTLRVGDHFYSPGNRQRSTLSGEIVKVNRVNFTYKITYFGQPMELTAAISELSLHSRLIRGTVAYELV